MISIKNSIISILCKCIKYRHLSVSKYFKQYFALEYRIKNARYYKKVNNMKYSYNITNGKNCIF